MLYRCLTHYSITREMGNDRLMLDLEVIERALYNADGPAYRLLEAMASVKAQERHNGFLEAPPASF